VEGPGPAGRQQVQQPEAPEGAGGLGLDVLHLAGRQDVLLVQERNDAVGDQQLAGQIQPVCPQQSSVGRLHAEAQVAASPE